MHIFLSRLILTGLISTATALPVMAQAAAPGMHVSVVSDVPTNADTDLLVICLFRSSPRNQLSGSLTAINQKLNGLLEKIRTPALFDGQVGETVLLTPPAGAMKPQRILAIGMGDSETFTPERMYEVGKIAYLEATRLGATHPWFAAAVLDGGVKQFTTGAVASVVVRGFRDAAQLEHQLQANGVAKPVQEPQFSYLAGGENAPSTRAGIASTLSK